MAYNNANGAAISSESLERLRAINPSARNGLLPEMIDLFLEDTPKRLAALEEVASQGSAREIAAAAHALKNNANHFGAEKMRAICSQIEEQALEGQSNVPPSLLLELAHECDRVQQALIAEKSRF